MTRKKRRDPPTGPRAQRARRHRPSRLRYRLAVAAVWAVVAFGILAAWVAAELPDPRAIAAFDKPTTVHLAYADGTPFITLAASGETAVALADLPRWLPQAVIATEDRRYYQHSGLDLRGIARALVVNLRAGAVREGASTITQQLARNLFLGPERHLKRKAQEAMLALWLERRLTKDEILELYLNRVYFGAGAYGVDAAARRYFGKPAHRVDVAEAAMLAGLLKAPSRYAPTVNLAGAQARAAVVLERMVAAEFLAPAAAAAVDVRAVTVRDVPMSGHSFVGWVMDQIPDFIGAARGEFRVVTTLDRTVQESAERAVTSAIRRDGAARDFDQAALVALSHDGAVRAMIGGADGRGSFNRAVDARRQPGSAFKPIVYLAGLEAGLEPSTKLIDGPIAIGGWRPANIDGTFVGEVTLTDAFARSINTVAVQVAERAGRSRVAAAGRRLGIGSPLPAIPSLALGTAEVTPLELTAAYVAIANGGTGVWPYAIVEVVDERGATLFRREGSGPGPAMATATAAKLARMMRATIQHGTGRAAQLDRPAAGKTGTSQDFRDAWFLGFTADLTAGVWVGNDDNSPMNRVTGGDVPARVWRDFMLAAHRGRPARELMPFGLGPPRPAVARAPDPPPAPSAPPPPPARTPTAPKPEPDGFSARGRE
ncbi:MAG: PBP1A family penicillin-binding protein [Alphaproteobacteria bacterium]|nr:PBP1A family penicillin-binding protein [Alphaproteobacteria bacterium]